MVVLTRNRIVGQLSGLRGVAYGMRNKLLRRGCRQGSRSRDALLPASAAPASADGRQCSWFCPKVSLRTGGSAMASTFTTNQASQSTTRWHAALGFVLVFGIGSENIASAAQQVVPAGTVIDDLNVDKYEQYLSPAMVWIVKRGVNLPVTEYRHLEFPPPFR